MMALSGVRNSCDMLARKRSLARLALSSSSFFSCKVLSKRLRFAIGLATALSGLHKSELIHKDVKPANVLVDPATGQVRLMGFGMATRLPRERQAPAPPEFIAGTLSYMAPEQTGRMNRSIDSRSDLYALGATLYEMLTGTLPFSATDPMELVHSHIADRKSTRLNSSHLVISYAVFCLKKKKAMPSHFMPHYAIHHPQSPRRC